MKKYDIMNKLYVVIKKGVESVRQTGIIDLFLYHNIEYSKLNLETINLQIQTCIMLLDDLYGHKPLFFQKKKMESYNKQVEKLKQKLIGYYKVMEIEMESLGDTIEILKR